MIQCRQKKSDREDSQADNKPALDLRDKNKMMTLAKLMIENQENVIDEIVLNILPRILASTLLLIRHLSVSVKGAEI